MAKSSLNRFLLPAGILLLVWIALRYLLPLLLPFLLGALLALAAEPGVRLLTTKARLPRFAAAGISVTLTLVLLGCILLLVVSVAVRQLGRLSAVLPEVAESAMDGLSSLESYLFSLAQRAPASVRSTLSDGVIRLFHSGDTVNRVAGRLPDLLSSLVSLLSSSALSIGTGILAGYMVSIRLPRIRQWCKESPQLQHLRSLLPILQRIKTALGGWLKAQLKLSSLSFFIVCLGLLLLKIPYAPIWALLTALVDAIPVLGTGTVLLPWALVCLIQGQSLRAIGLLLTYGAAFLSRSVLEPKLVGKQLGLDPLLTLLSLYIGFQLWGIAGMLLSPLAAVAVKELSKPKPTS